jgi:4-hydroxybenzoate polyprenyltransferase
VTIGEQQEIRDPARGEPSLVPDSERRGLIAALPRSLRPFALLARFDRPIGWWLLYWPCVWSVALSGNKSGGWSLVVWLLAGAIAMRGAGCVYNDILDRELDARVERTRDRPLASGAVSVRAAWIWLLILVGVGFAVWLHLNFYAKLAALGTLPLVALYPLMKRVTWWPQLWLGLVFGSGAVIGFLAANAPMVELGISEFFHAMLLLYGGTIAWVVGYDTIYALQDVEDDGLVGIRSSARRLGRHARIGITGFYALAVALWGAALWTVRPDGLSLVALVPMALHLGWQVVRLRPDDGEDALAKFRSNRFAGLLMFLACLVVGTS